MELELRIIRDPYGGLGKQPTRVFGEAGGSVGRAPDSYWLLPDPECHLSGHHCDIHYRDGAFWVSDTSRNGVFLNDSERPLGFGSRAKLADGDVIYLARYTVQARVRRRPVHAPVPVPVEAVPPAQVEVAAEELAEPLIAPEALFAPAEPAASEAQAQGEAATAIPLPSPVTAEESQAETPETLETPDIPETPETPVQRQQAAESVESTAEHEQMYEKDDPTADTDFEAPEAPEPTLPVEPDAELPRLRPDEQPAELLETRVLDPALVATELKRVIHINRARLQADGHLPPPKIERLVANQFRQLKRPLIKNAFGKGAEPVPNGHLVMVTSSLPDEGKTFSSINVAFGLAREKDIEVLLVDADVAKQHLSRIFGIHEAPGLLNALAEDSIDVESLILATDIKGLSLLPSGQCAEDDIATELLASSRMDAVAARLGGQKSQRIVLFDSPPVLLTNESRVLASLMGQVLLVVRAGVTPRSAVLEAIGYLDKEKPLGLVLNQAKSHAPGGYYGYGAFGYGGYGDDDGEAGQAAKKPGRKQN